MKSIYIYLDLQDKTRLLKQATSYQLALTTYCDIIYKHYQFAVPKKYQKTYIHKGTEKIHINMRLKNLDTANIKDVNVTNAIYLFLNRNKATVKVNFTNMNKAIQSEAENTIDNTFMQYQILKNMYRLQRKVNK